MAMNAIGRMSAVYAYQDGKLVGFIYLDPIYSP